MTKLNVRIPTDEHRLFKAKASLKGLTLMEAILEAIRDWMRKAQS